MICSSQDIDEDKDDDVDEKVDEHNLNTNILNSNLCVDSNSDNLSSEIINAIIAVQAEWSRMQDMIPTLSLPILKK
jgi:hypothetical protein